MSLSFRTNGNFIDFVNTDATSINVETVIRSLHNTSRSISWSLPADTTRINFTIDSIKYHNISITDIDFDGTVMNSQDDFETGITAMFPGLASGSSGGVEYLVYTALINQSGANAPVATEIENTLGAVVWSRYDVGGYNATLAGAFTANKTFFSITASEPTGIAGGRQDVDNMYVQTFDTITGNAQDGVMTEVSVEIRVYPE